MRLVRWAIFLAALGWLGYSVAGAGMSYFAAQEILDDALRDAAARHRTTQRQSETNDLASYVRMSIVLAAHRDGLAVQPADVEVSTAPGELSATLRWSYPIISYGDKDLLVIPMSLRRSTLMAP